MAGISFPPTGAELLIYLSNKESYPIGGYRKNLVYGQLVIRRRIDRDRQVFMLLNDRKLLLLSNAVQARIFYLIDLHAKVHTQGIVWLIGQYQYLQVPLPAWNRICLSYRFQLPQNLFVRITFRKV